MKPRGIGVLLIGVGVGGARVSGPYLHDSGDGHRHRAGARDRRSTEDAAPCLRP